jgi:renalase
MRVVVIGAGVAGLVAARELAEQHEVLVLDKGRSVGGRLATRRIGDASLDHGAQFFTARGRAFRAQTDDWVERGVARVWCHGFHERADGYPRYVGAAGMNALAKDLARGIDCRCNTLAFTVRRDGDGWCVMTDDGNTEHADAVVLTCPLPQTWALLAESGVELPDQLIRTDYERTISLLAVLDGPSAVPEPGGVQSDTHDDANAFTFVADQQAKGVSRVAAITCHATVPFSHANWDRTVAELETELRERARPYVGDATIVAAQVKKWRFATPATIWPDGAYVVPDQRIVLAGDAFAGPKVEGAFVSGLAAAHALTP